MDNRQKDLNDFGDKLLSDQVNKNIDKLLLDDNFEQRWNEILFNACNLVFYNAENSYKRGRKNETEYVCFSLLKSSIMTGSYDIEISILDDKYLLDRSDTSVYWSPYAVYDYIDTDMIIFTQNVRNSFARVTNYEILSFKMHHTINYHKIMFYNLMKSFKSLLECNSFKELSKCTSVKFLFGFYMEKVYCFYIYDNKNNNIEFLFDEVFSHIWPDLLLDICSYYSNIPEVK